MERSGWETDNRVCEMMEQKKRKCPSPLLDKRGTSNGRWRWRWGAAGGGWRALCAEGVVGVGVGATASAEEWRVMKRAGIE